MSEKEMKDVNEDLNQEEKLDQEEIKTDTLDDQGEEGDVIEQEDSVKEKKEEDWQDKYLRLYSEFDNFRRRTAKEKADLIVQANAGVFKELLSVVDDFDRAIQANENNNDPESLKEGFKLIHTKFFGVLKNKGLEPTDALGKDFNVDEHEALTNIPVEDESQKGKVVDVIEKGYSLNGSILRYAKVVVGQ